MAIWCTVDRAFHTLISLEHLVTLAWFPQATTPMSLSHLKRKGGVTEDLGPGTWSHLSFALEGTELVQHVDIC